MKKDLLKCLLLSMPLAGLFTACVDDSYNLSDIDTTTRFKVVDLVIPANIDPITLGDVIKIDGGSKIQNVNIGGQNFYALVEKGDFSSTPISIKGVKAVPTPISETRDPLSRIIGEQSSKRRLPEGEYLFRMQEIGKPFSYNAFNIDNAIVSIDAVETVPFTFSLNLEIQDENATIGSMLFQDLKIRLPKGLTAKTSTGSYDSESGIWTVPQVAVQSNRADISLEVTAIDFKTAGINILNDRSLDFKSEFIIEDGYVAITPKATSFQDEVMLIVNYGLSEFEVKSFSGSVQYSMDGFDIPNISLSNLPDFLKGEETHIEIANPQIYLQLNNPVSTVPLECSLGLTLSAVRYDHPTLDFSLDSPLVIGAAATNTTPLNFVLSPKNSGLSIPEGFDTNLKWQQFSTLGSVLTTPSSWTDRGLPNQIGITVDDPSVPVQSVKNLAIPQTFPAVEGKYEIMAPLALNDGSYVYYTEVRDGWNDEDVDEITVTQLTVTAHAVNNIPASISLVVYPVDKYGNIIDATVKSNVIPASSKSNLEIVLEGEIRHLDGIRLEAVLESNGSQTPLSKDQTLDLTDIRAKVSGYYDRKL